ncbi:MAG TPA: maltotransferase domain-containing protein [Geminicoccaceae bacterium]|nr:maltotransferase domain-containing protein [Geminicoccaceae bacterium]
MTDWARHLPRIRAMGFDRVYVNAFFAPGDSGSIYAVRDPHELHPVVRGDATGPADELVRGFLRAAREQGLSVLTDLILPHTARDARLVDERPDWYRRDATGRILAPVLANPGDPHRPRILEDLAELDVGRPELHAALLDHFAADGERFLGHGFAGFRCSAAYKVPRELWRELIAKLRRIRPDCLMIAAALGCPFEQTLALAGCGFDYLFDSSRWWDFRSDWLLDQYEQVRRIAPTISFPEDHNTPRLAAELGLDEPLEIERHYRARYLFAAGFGSGLLMPMGFEYGCRRRLHPSRTRPEDWREETERPAVDLGGFIAEVNALKARTEVLNVPGPERRVTAPNGQVVGLLRLDAGTPMAAGSAALLLHNPDPARADGVDPGLLLAAAGGRIEAFSDMTPGAAPRPFTIAEPLTLDPLELRLYCGQVTARKPGRGVDAATAEQRLRDLAAERIAIEKVQPELDGGRFAVKRVVGDRFEVTADMFGDGHEKIAAVLQYRAQDEAEWREAPMRLVDNDRWAGEFPLTRNIRYLYTILAWRDLFASWCGEVSKKHDAGLNVSLELIEGRALIEKAAAAAGAEDRAAFDALLARLDERRDDQGGLLATLLGREAKALMARAGIRTNLSRYERELEVVVDRTGAAFAAWYELMPRSQSGDPNRHGTFDDVIRRLPYVRDMGFDVLYFPPIHPIGRTNRKGRNNSLTPRPGDPGSPYAIGAEEGGHTAIHPELGTLDDFRRLVEAAHAHGLEIALDFAIQCAPDHPWIKQHPEWFDWRPDGTIKFAENPPKKYEDIVNVHFYRDALPSLWYELRDVVLFWVEQGVKIFRVDNPHTKPFPFWEWMIREVQDRHPDTAFLSEAFTRPKVMKRLAKVGFTQSYSYFTWRNTKAELIEYLTELTQDEPREHMRPNFFVNTPDINPVFLQTGGRPAHQIRAVLAATLSPLYGVYSGFELCEATPVPGKEEYLDSEKYEIRAWDWDRPGNIRDFITRLNKIRRDNPALWRFTNLEFHNAWNDSILLYSKMTESGDNAVLVAINLDPHHAQGGNIEVPLWKFRLGDGAPILVEDLLTGRRFTWQGKIQHLWLDPHQNPCAVWRMIPPGLPA